MARTQEIIENISCDVCGKPLKEATTVALGWNGDRWEVDLCPADHQRVSTQFDKWIANGRPARRAASTAGRRRNPRASSNATSRTDDWAYLESLGFKRHRGRKSSEEADALAARSV